MTERVVAAIDSREVDDKTIHDNPELELILEAGALDAKIQQLYQESQELAGSNDIDRVSRLTQSMAHLSERLAIVRGEMGYDNITTETNIDGTVIVHDEVQSNRVSHPTIEDEGAQEIGETPPLRFSEDGKRLLQEVFGDLSDVEINENDIDVIILAIQSMMSFTRSLKMTSKEKLRLYLLEDQYSDSSLLPHQVVPYIGRLFSRSFLSQSTPEARKDILKQSVEEFRRPVEPVIPSTRLLHSYQTIERDPLEPLAWQSDALCAQTDPETFFPEKGGTTSPAKKICAACEVKTECLEYALENDERHGIWGGLSEGELRKLRRSKS
jgi:WhiB family transcriptional regulator, redox-sensing transcriptional regulator